MLDEFTNSVGSVFKERIVSPLFGTFFISWCIWNWRLLYYLVAVDSKVDMQQRFAYMDERFFHPGSLDTFLRLLLGPFALSAVWLWLYPVVNNKIETYLAKKRAYKLKLIQEIDKTIPLAHEEAMAIFERAEKQEERYAKLSKDNVDRIAKLNEQNQRLTNEKQEWVDSENYYRTELNSTQQKLTDYTAENEKLKAKLNDLNQEVREAKFGKWANNDVIIGAYTLLLQEPSLSRLYATLLTTPNLQYPGHTNIQAARDELERLMDLNLISYLGEKEPGQYSISFTDRGWQLLSLFKYRQELEQLLKTSPKKLRALPSFKSSGS